MTSATTYPHLTEKTPMTTDTAVSTATSLSTDLSRSTEMNLVQEALSRARMRRPRSEANPRHMEMRAREVRAHELSDVARLMPRLQ
jgi:hypothetical protein